MKKITIIPSEEIKEDLFIGNNLVKTISFFNNNFSLNLENIDVLEKPKIYVAFNLCVWRSGYKSKRFLDCFLSEEDAKKFIEDQIKNLPEGVPENLIERIENGFRFQNNSFFYEEVELK